MLQRRLARTQALCADRCFELTRRCELRRCLYALHRHRVTGLRPGRARFSSSPRQVHDLTSPDWARGPQLSPQLQSHWNGIGSPVSPATSALSTRTDAALALAEAEELHESQQARLLRMLDRRHTRVIRLLVGVRRRQCTRTAFCALRQLVALRRATRLKAAGSRLARLLPSLECRRLLRAVLCVWRLATGLGAREREERRVVSTVTAERLGAAEEHFASLLRDEVAAADGMRERCADLVRTCERRRQFAACWTALRVGGASHRLERERLAWRQMLRELQPYLVLESLPGARPGSPASARRAWPRGDAG